MTCMISKPRAIYRQIADDLRRQIVTGEIAPGAPLPSHSEIASTYQVDAATASRAVNLVVDEGLARARHGARTIARPLATLHRDATSRYGKAARERSQGAFAAEMQERGLKWASDEVIRYDTPPPHVADLMGEPHTKAQLVRARVMSVEGIPVQLADSWIPEWLAKDTPLEGQGEKRGGIISTMRELGHAQTSIEERIAVRTPSDEEARTLDMGATQRVYEINHIGRTDAAKVVEVCIHIMPTHLWDLSYTWAID